MFVNLDKFFPMKKEELIYFDNAATTFKPIQVINKEIEYISVLSFCYKASFYDQQRSTTSFLLMNKILHQPQEHVFLKEQLLCSKYFERYFFFTKSNIS